MTNNYHHLSHQTSCWNSNYDLKRGGKIEPQGKAWGWLVAAQESLHQITTKGRDGQLLIEGFSKGVGTGAINK